jgi:ribonucleoside-diphosphate reductase alpha chain
VHQSDKYKSPEKLAIKKQLKELQDKGEAPIWMNWFGYQKLLGGYLLKDETPKDMYRRVAKAAANYLPEDNKKWEEKFFELFWKNWLAGSTPVLGNLGTDRGMAVSCSAQYCGDTLEDILGASFESGMLSKYGFGTAIYLDLRDGYSPIATGGYSNNIKDWIEQNWFIQNKVTQSNLRRGSVAQYIDFWHGDLFDILPMLETHDRLHLGIICDDSVREALEAGNEDAMKRYRTILNWRARKGKPYIIFIDNAKRQDPASYKKLGLESKHSNLCTEIFLHTDKDHTLSCVLSSLNCVTYNEWKDTDAVQTAVIFLDCVAEDLIQRGKNIRGLEKVIRHTIKGRALGLGLLGFHTYLQKNMVPLDSIRARAENNLIFKHIKQEAEKATKFLANWLGEPEWCKGEGRRNTHLLAIAPNTSSAVIAGGNSQGIEPNVANVYTQKLAKGTIDRINPVLLDLLRSKNKYTNEIIDSIAFNKGSVQHLDFLSDLEKEVFKTAYELPQKLLIDLADQRQQYICQGQSLNLFFAADEDEEYIHEVHKHAFEKKWLKSLYYVRTMPGITADKSDCTVCEG